MRVVMGIVASVLAGCGVHLADDQTAHSAVDAAPPPTDSVSVIPTDGSVPADARPCAGGNQAEAGPNNTCFVLFNTPLDWAGAKAACVAFNSHLAILDTAGADAVAEVMLTVDAFVGGTDQAAEGVWRWVDNTLYGTFTHWRSGEPNNGGTGGAPENCMVVAGSKATKGWDDKPCAPTATSTAGSYPYLCEY